MSGKAGRRSRRQGADERLARILALVPWVAARDGPTVEEVCARFDCTEQELVDDLELLFLCGLHPYTPDVLIDVDVADGRAWIRYAEYFSRPLRLTPQEGLVLLAAGSTLLSTPGGEPDGPLARGLAKLATALGVEAEGAVEVALAPAPRAAVEALRDALARHRQVEIDYYAFGRDEWSRRVVDPYALFSAGGQWYLSAYCHAVDDERLFRVDRIREASVLDVGFAPPAQPPELTVYVPRPEDPRVVLDLEPAARWVREQYPLEKVEELGEGRLRVTLAASEQAWLERLLLRLGRDATMVTGDTTVAPRAAARILRRYRDPAADEAPAEQA
ncbi:MAG: WYL domain-containing protein [Actinomycetota bacterium]|nr:WYL domain-containing protein [Actinomycetota bacterium]